MRTVRRHTWWFLSAWGLLIVYTAAAQIAPMGYEPLLEVEPHPKLETGLQALAVRYREAPMAARSLAANRGVDLMDGAVQVIIEPEGGRPEAVDRDALERLGGTITRNSDRLWQAVLSLETLLEIVDSVSGIAYVRFPYRPRALVVSEGIAVFGAEDYHDEGYYGQGADVAVIDLGFSGLNNAQSNGELSNVENTLDYTGSGLQTGISHGTAVAEILEDVAPQSDLHLLKISDEVELDNAVDYCTNNGIEVIVHSVGWYNTCYYDGTGVISDIANNGRDQGIFWVNAAGNQAADGHWQGPFVDHDNDNNHDFGSGSDYLDGDNRDEGANVTLAGGDTLTVLLTWNDWDYTPGQGSDQDYHLFLIDNTGSVVAFSDDAQTGTQDPTERLTFNVPSGGGTYELLIVKWDAPAEPDLELFTYVSSTASTSMQFHQASSSIVTPANSAKAFAVGSIDYDDWETGPIDDRSSRGPSNDSLYSSSIVRPDIVGPDGVSTYTYGATAFQGTSASAPHVGGAAALLLSQDPSRTADQLETYLENSAVDMGAAGKDNSYGSGRIRLQIAPLATAATFRVTHEGDALADGTVHASSFATGHADIAEWVAISEPAAPGAVLALDPLRPGAYRLANGPCFERVAGIVSTSPGVVLGHRFEGERALLALAGIVPAKVVDEGGTIAPGDLLVTSSIPGMAMRWSGTGPCPCALVGKALEPMTAPKGIILVLLTAH